MVSARFVLVFDFSELANRIALRRIAFALAFRCDLYLFANTSCKNRKKASLLIMKEEVFDEVKKQTLGNQIGSRTS